jgi:uncharacterized protein
MFSRLPTEIDPLRLADEGRTIEGELPAGQFIRLDGLTGAVKVALHFERLAHGARRMHGRIEASVETPCQRCLEPVLLQLRAEPDVLLKAGDVKNEEGSEAEVLAVNGPFNLAEYVEDELLLAMPMIPVHTDPACELPGSVRK